VKARLVAPCLAAFVAVASGAHAASNAETADAMFREAKKAMDAGDYPRACPLFEESQRLDPGGGTLMNLALCEEKLGKLATAQKRFAEAAARARADGRADRLGEASAHLAALAPRVPTLTLVSTRALGAIGRVSIDGRPVRAEEINTKLPLDPGSHAVRIEPEGAPATDLASELKESEHVRLSLDEGGQALPVTPPKPEPEPAPPRPPPPFRPPPPLLEVPAHRPSASFSVASWAAFGVAAAGGGTALVTGLMALSARSEYAETCFDERAYCTDSTARASGERARGLAWVSTVSLGVGVAALWTALLLPRTYPVTVAPQGAGLSLRATF